MTDKYLVDEEKFFIKIYEGERFKTAYTNVEINKRLGKVFYKQEFDQIF